MKTLYLITFIFLNAINIYSQDVIKRYDKYENKFYILLEDELVLTTLDENKDSGFNLNILKSFNSNDTVYYLIVTAKYKFKYFCSSILSNYFILYDNSKSILLNPLHYECDEDKFRKKYIFDFQISKNDLINLGNARDIKIMINCTDGEMQGDFSEDNIKEFRKFIKNYVL